jgi:hypothetical protein
MVIAMNDIVNVTAKDMDRYRALVADIDGMSHQQKEEAILIVVNMMQAFVDAAWGVHPEQLALKNANIDSSQQVSEDDRISALGTAMTVDLKDEGAIIKNKNADFAP